MRPAAMALKPAPPPVPTLPRTGRRQVLLIGNARASRLGSAPDALARVGTLLRSRGARVETRLTGDLEEFAATALSAEGRRVALLGGDGSVHAAANLAGAVPEIALLPAGRANNIAHSLGLPLDLPAAAELAVEGSAASLDLIAVTDGRRRMRAVEGVSVGVHAQARAGYRAPNSGDLRAGLESRLTALRELGYDVGSEASS